jgi:hypothetical protein
MSPLRSRQRAQVNGGMNNATCFAVIMHRYLVWRVVLSIVDSKVSGIWKEVNRPCPVTDIYPFTESAIIVLRNVSQPRPHRHRCGNYRNTVANMDASDSRCRCIGKNIARNLRLVVSRLNGNAITQPRVTCLRYTCNIPVVYISSNVTNSYLPVKGISIVYRRIFPHLSPTGTTSCCQLRGFCRQISS